MASQKCLAILLVSTFLGQISAVSIRNEDHHSMTISKEDHAFADDSCYPPIQVLILNFMEADFIKNQSLGAKPINEI